MFPSLIDAVTGELPPFTAATILSQTRVDGWLAAMLLLTGGCYLYGVHRLKARGDKWPVNRTIMFVGFGLGSIALVTLTGIGAYDTTLVSVHMVQHMVLGMVAPIFLALGAPVTLALRTLPKKPRALLLGAVHSKVARVLAFPLVAYAIFVANPFVLYFSDLYRQTLEHPWLHEFMHAHFIATGCLFFWPLLGLDPLPGRWPYPGRALLMVLSVPFHTVLGLTIMQQKNLLGGDYYPSLGLTWANPASDQVTAGGILWAGGELVSVTMLAVLVVQWIRASEREAARVDRQLDREEAEAARHAAAQATGQPSGPPAAQPADMTSLTPHQAPEYDQRAATS
ncbi:putative copper resistance protein D [Hamadaea flava]|uniref:Cytochrome c oxidase assembly protein n=1 Tax=Hamadaea flava TaxID=1742688 RepID=A0ABV8LTJ9_9ACTN|nr:cytochrome c oxidase assembly protein [Hamadaea flava]MCP2327849.1 putative copper resistance protein D [Hamadaea flava]